MTKADESVRNGGVTIRPARIEDARDVHALRVMEGFRAVPK